MAYLSPWLAKFDSNVKRDRRTVKALAGAGWKVLVVWECEVLRDPQEVLARLVRELGVHRKVVYEALPARRMILKAAERKLQWKLGG